MTKYPKEWIGVLTKGAHTKKAVELLDALNEIGALKTPPKPREFTFCTHLHCMTTLERCKDQSNHKEDNFFIHMRQVVE